MIYFVVIVGAFLLLFWIGLALGTLVAMLPVIVVVAIGAWIGLNWWQSLLVGIFAYAFAAAAIEQHRYGKPPT